MSTLVYLLHHRKTTQVKIIRALRESTSQTMLSAAEIVVTVPSPSSSPSASPTSTTSSSSSSAAACQPRLNDGRRSEEAGNFSLHVCCQASSTKLVHRQRPSKASSLQRRPPADPPCNPQPVQQLQARQGLEDVDGEHAKQQHLQHSLTTDAHDVMSALNIRVVDEMPPRARDGVQPLHISKVRPAGEHARNTDHDDQVNDDEKHDTLHRKPQPLTRADSPDINSDAASVSSVYSTPVSTMLTDGTPKRRAKTPVLRIGQLEDQAKRKMFMMRDFDAANMNSFKPALGKMDSTEALADHYRSLLSISRSSTPCSLRSTSSSASLKSSLYQPHRSLRKVKRHESLRSIMETPEPGYESSPSPSSSDCETLVESDEGRADRSKTGILDDVWEDEASEASEGADSTESSESSDVFVDAPEFRDPSPRRLSLPPRTKTPSTGLRTPSLTRITNAFNGRSSPLPRFATPPLDANVNLQICVDLMAAELSSVLQSSSMPGDGLGRQKAQLWLLIEAYEGLKQRIQQSGLPSGDMPRRLQRSKTAADKARIDNLLGVLDNWLDALYATYGILIEQQSDAGKE